MTEGEIGWLTAIIVGFFAGWMARPFYAYPSALWMGSYWNVGHLF